VVARPRRRNPEHNMLINWVLEAVKYRSAIVLGEQ
jgi:hypothetical protein